MFRRPKNVEECITMLDNASELSQKFLDPSNKDHFAIWKAVSSLQEANWTRDLIRPLYTEAMMVEVGMNIFTPKLIEILCTPNKVKHSDSKDNKTLNFQNKLLKLREACDKELNNQTKSQSMQKIIQVLYILSRKGEMEEGLLAMHRSCNVSRLFWDMMIPKLVEMVHNDTDVRKSTDVPLDLYTSI